MTPVLIGMALCVVAALVVLALVAVPRVREGDKLLTQDGHQSVREASRRAKALASQAVGRAGDAAQDVRGRAGGVVTDVRGKAQDVRDKTPTRARGNGDGPPDAVWTPAPELRPARSRPSAAGSHPGQDGRSREEERATRTVTVDVAAPSLTGSPGDAAIADHVIDLRDRDPGRAEPQPSTPVAQPDTSPMSSSADAAVAPGGANVRSRSRSLVSSVRVPARRTRRRDRHLDLGWGEPRPGPRHGR